MKGIIKFLCLTVVIAVAVQFLSCSGNDSPIGKYVELVNKVTDEVTSINSLEELRDIDQADYAAQLSEIMQTSGNYELTDSDKEKLKKAYDRFLNEFFKKTLDLSNLPDEIKETMSSQKELAIERVNTSIENSKTLSEIQSIIP